jgi:hypothetical protein
MSIYSTPEQLSRIGEVVGKYLKLPLSADSVPGSFMEGVLAHVRGGEVLNTYDFVDVIDRKSKLGWQVKSTKVDTPLTWKRAKIPNAADLIGDSRKSNAGLQALGDAIIDFCNEHAHESLQLYGLKEIGYSRLLLEPSGKIVYFERLLCTSAAPDVFKKAEFSWQWSTPKQVTKKEQLQALHGVHRPTGRKWWAWHGLGENQLHFSGEDCWWPARGTTNRFEFAMPSDRLNLERFLALLANS